MSEDEIEKLNIELLANMQQSAGESDKRATPNPAAGPESRAACAHRFLQTDAGAIGASTAPAVFFGFKDHSISAKCLIHLDGAVAERLKAAVC